MTKGLSLEIIWFDEDLIELRRVCSNGRFAGGAEFYGAYDDLPNLGKKLRDFPLSGADRRQVELGTFNPEYRVGSG